jgi:glycosyltransferase involved in cell wall biosynthesis
MRILHLIQRYYPARGGAELLLESISNHLAAAGHQVMVVTTDALDFELFWDPRRRRIEQPVDHHQDVAIRRFPVRHLPLSGLAYPGLRRLLWLMSRVSPIPESLMLRLAHLTPWTPDLWRWAAVQSEPFDLVASMTIVFEPFVAAGLSIARRQGIPFVCYPLTHLGAGEAPASDALSRFYTMRHQIGLVAASDAIIAQTPAEKSFYVDRGIAANKISAVGPGVRPAEVLGGDGARFRYRLGLEGPLVLYVGSMSADKGAVQTVEAVRSLWRAGRQVELALIGAVLTPFAAYLRGLPAADRDRIHVLGPVDDDQKRDALDAATVFSMPSRTDSFGITYLEAWLNGLPVIGARTWGVMDLIHEGRDGLLVPFDDKPAQSGAPALAGAIAYLLDHPDKAAQMGQAGREKVLAEHTWDIKFRMVDEIYQRLVKNAAAS